MSYDDLKVLVEKYGQSHILKAYERLNDEGKSKLLAQVAKIDFEKMKDLYKISQEKIEMKEAVIEPMSYTDSAKLSENEKAELYNLGKEAIKSGKLAVVTMAGGQGTRLGHNGPKGTYDLGLDSHKSLFEIQCDALKDAKDKYGVTIPWYIMTSKENNDDTVAFFEKNNFFGYPKEASNYFFKQGELPMIDEEGKLIIQEDGYIKEAADGHGGVFEAIGKNGIIKDMKARGIEWVFIGGIDNVLAQLADPMLIGYAIKNNFRIVSKTIPKANPEEKVGVFCKKDGKPNVIEYTEISNELANTRDNEGELLYGEAHVLLNLFNVNVLEEIEKFKLPYHVAHKKSSYINDEGILVTPEAPNAYKFEAFLFDAFSQIPDIGLYRGKRELDFSPVKNAAGTDSPETARRDYINYHKNK